MAFPSEKWCHPSQPLMFLHSFIYFCLSSDQGFEGDPTQQEPEAAVGGGAGLWKLHEQGSEGERIRLQGVFAQQDC